MNEKYEKILEKCEKLEKIELCRKKISNFVEKEKVVQSSSEFKSST